MASTLVSIHVILGIPKIYIVVEPVVLALNSILKIPPILIFILYMVCASIFLILKTSLTDSFVAVHNHITTWYVISVCLPT